MLKMNGISWNLNYFKIILQFLHKNAKILSYNIYDIVKVVIT